MSAIPDSLKEFIHDEDGQYSEAQLLSLVRQLQAEGRKNRSLCRALYRIMLTVSAEMGAGDDYGFLLRTRDLLNDAVTMTENSLDRMRDQLPITQ